MTYQVNYFLGKPKQLTSHTAEVEAKDAFNALRDFRDNNPEARVTACIEKPKS
jgi:hypothetical protein